MSGVFAKSALAISVVAALALLVATGADAQRHYRRRAPRETERAPAISFDSRDTIVAAPGPFKGQPYWLALADCGGIYFKLNVLYTDAAVRARVVKPDPRANAEFTKKLNEAINTATLYFDAAEEFLRTDRGLDRDAAILTYDAPSRVAGDRAKTIDAALAAARACPALYRACHAGKYKACGGKLAPLN